MSFHSLSKSLCALFKIILAPEGLVTNVGRLFFANLVHNFLIVCFSCFTTLSCTLAGRTRPRNTTPKRGGDPGAEILTSNPSTREATLKTLNCNPQTLKRDSHNLENSSKTPSLKPCFNYRTLQNSLETSSLSTSDNGHP